MHQTTAAQLANLTAIRIRCHHVHEAFSSRRHPWWGDTDSDTPHTGGAHHSPRVEHRVAWRHAHTPRHAPPRYQTRLKQTHSKLSTGCRFGGTHAANTPPALHSALLSHSEHRTLKQDRGTPSSNHVGRDAARCQPCVSNPPRIRIRTPPYQLLDIGCVLSAAAPCLRRSLGSAAGTRSG